jgi:predicted RNA-binding protein YlxR (DUF448 family)
MSTPERTCVGCRQKAAKTELLRVVADQAGQVVIDYRQSAPGRGAYLHPECLTANLRKRVLERALRVVLPDSWQPWPAA